MMKQLIIDMYKALNLIKDFDAGYSTLSSDQMMVDHNGKRYMVTFEELCDVNDEDMFDTMDKYWENKKEGRLI